MPKSKFYFTKQINSEAIVNIYKKLGRQLVGRVGVKISTGEMGGHNYLKPELISQIVEKLNGTIVECNTAYGGSRQETKDHLNTIKEHKFDQFFKVQILDAEGEKKIPVTNGFHLDYDIVGKDMDEYDSFLILSHFKGHQMAGMGGALKNISIGFASSAGKAYIHSAGVTTDTKACWRKHPGQDAFLESMADAVEAVTKYVGEKNMVYINVANRLSVDCDCNSNPAEPEMADIGIFASLDPVAVDKACYDAVHNSEDKGKASLVNRMEKLHAHHILETASKHNLGSLDYEVVSLDER